MSMFAGLAQPRSLTFSGVETSSSGRPVLAYRC
jgi:hypothetical protein